MLTADPFAGVERQPSQQGRRRLPLFRRILNGTAAGFIGVFAIAAVFASVLAPYGPNDTDPSNTYAKMSWSHPFGTDGVGRDILSRLIFGARSSLAAVLLATLIGAGVGVIPGLFAGYFRGAPDAVGMRLSDTITAFPPLILALAVVAVLGPGLTNAMIAIGILLVPRFFRLMRASALEQRHEAYVEAAKIAGVSSMTIIFRHILPNARPVLTIQLAFTAGVAIIAEASLSFVGLGSQPPTASWGNMVSLALPYLESRPRLIIVPGLVITLAVLAFNIVGDGLRDRWGRDA